MGKFNIRDVLNDGGRDVPRRAHIIITDLCITCDIFLSCVPISNRCPNGFCAAKIEMFSRRWHHRLLVCCLIFVILDCFDCRYNEIETTRNMESKCHTGPLTCSTRGVMSTRRCYATFWMAEYVVWHHMARMNFRFYPLLMCVLTRKSPQPIGTID